MSRKDNMITLIALLLGLIALISYGLGVLAYLPPENRAKKIEETLEKHKTKSERKAQPWSG